MLLHAPSVYDFRSRSILYGPVSDLVPSSPVFEMYPIGFTSILEYLERHGFNVKIVNLALLMMLDQRFDAEALIAKMNPTAFGIDLHWLPHAHGSIEVAKIIKKYHPQTPVIFGGYSASYFHEELLGHNCIDYVLRGDSTEKLMLMLMRCISRKAPVDGIPNLSYRRNDEIICNDLSFVPDNIDDLVFDYSSIIRATAKYRSIRGFLPFKGWVQYPISAVLTCRGCTCGCVNCGGSASALSRVVGRKKPAFRDPERVAQDIINIQKHFRGPIFVLGDIMQKGDAYADALLQRLEKTKITNRVVFEFFKPWPEEMFTKVARAIPVFSIEGSIDSHDPSVRRAVGKYYDNEEMFRSIRAALDSGCERFDLYFMVGLPKQDSDSAVASAQYCRELYARLGGDRRLLVFTSPLAPFIDPGSPVFEDPKRFGYRMLAKSLDEHRRLLLEPSWKYVLNYETEKMTRDDIVEATYSAGLAFNQVKCDYGVIDQQIAAQTAARIGSARQILAEIDSIKAERDPAIVAKRLAALKSTVDGVSISTVCDKKELQWSHGWRSFNKLNILRTMLSRP